MSKQGFAKLQRSDRLIYGARKVLLSGFGPDAQSKFVRLLQMLEFSDLPLVWVETAGSETTLLELFQRSAGSGLGQASELPRAVIVAGIQENELHRLMSGCRQAGMRDALWATLTPTTESWRFGRLLRELQRERDALAKQ